MGVLFDKSRWDKATEQENKLEEKLAKQKHENKQLAQKLQQQIRDTLTGLVANRRAAAEQLQAAQRYVGQLESRLQDIENEYTKATLYGDTQDTERLQNEARSIRDTQLPQAGEDVEVARESYEAAEINTEGLRAEFYVNYPKLVIYAQEIQDAMERAGVGMAMDKEFDRLLQG